MAAWQFKAGHCLEQARNSVLGRRPAESGFAKMNVGYRKGKHADRLTRVRKQLIQRNSSDATDMQASSQRRRKFKRIIPC